MVKYPPATYAKAIVAFVTAFLGAVATAGSGVDFGALEFGQWLFAIGAGVTAGGGVFATPNREVPSPLDVAITQVEKAAKSVAKAQGVADSPAQADKMRQVREAVDGLAWQVGAEVVEQVAEPVGDVVDVLLDRIRKGL